MQFRILVSPKVRSDIASFADQLDAFRRGLAEAGLAQPDFPLPSIIPAPTWSFLARDERIAAADAQEKVASIVIDLRQIKTFSASSSSSARTSSFVTGRPIVRPLLEIAEQNGLQLNTNSPLQSTYAAPGRPFGYLDEALRMIGAVPPTASPSRVNVVIVDQGFNRELFPAANFGGGWFRKKQILSPPLHDIPASPMPGEGKSSHAAMVAHAVLAVAPHAILFDAPLIQTPPPGGQASIVDIPTFTLDAAALWNSFNDVLTSQTELVDKPAWVFVNAWSIYNTASDLPGIIQYTRSPQHYLTRLIDDVIYDWNVDHVFAAGNCGQFYPDHRCGRLDRGPCHSIWGANSLQSVLTVGAIRTDRNWLGFSSQGPGQTHLGVAKPDLCAPAEFASRTDADLLFGGTSGACGLAAGVVAAIRAQTPQFEVGPLELIDKLAATATRLPSTEHRTRVGAGIINLQRMVRL